MQLIKENMEQTERGMVRSMSIAVENISKRFGQTQALDGVSLSFEDGKIYGLLGRNGAGKTTLLNIISNRIFADSGTVTIDGDPAAENDKAQAKIYLMSEHTCYPETMRVKEAFRWTKAFYPAFDEDFARNLSDSFDLNTNTRVKGLSTGYLSIFKLTVALSANTPYLLLDEPVLGLDANHRDLFYKVLLAKYGEKPFTVVLSTHLIEEAAGFIEDVAIISRGKVLRACSREELTAGYYTVSGGAQAVENYLKGRKVLNVDVIGGLRSACVEGSPDREHAAPELEFSGVDLQKLFIQMTNS